MRRPAQRMGSADLAVPGLAVRPATSADMERHGGRGGFRRAKQPKGSTKEGTSLCGRRREKCQWSGASHTCTHARTHIRKHSFIQRCFSVILLHIISHSSPAPHRDRQALSWKIKSNTISLTVKLTHSGTDNLFQTKTVEREERERERDQETEERRQKMRTLCAESVFVPERKNSGMGVTRNFNCKHLMQQI